MVVKQKKHLLLVELLGRDGRVCDTPSLSSNFSCSANGILFLRAWPALQTFGHHWKLGYKNMKQALKEVRHIVHIKKVLEPQALHAQQK